MKKVSWDIGCPPCPVCIEHTEFHKREDLAARSDTLRDRLNQIGIFVPRKDPSDYCLSDKGEVVYFELDGIEYGLLREFIDREYPNASTNTSLDRFIKLAKYWNANVQRPFNRRFVRFSFS